MSVRNPDVPAAPGVPPVNRDNTNPGTAAQPAPLNSDTAAGAAIERQWGVFDKNGKRALEPDSIFAMEPSREFRISDYPVENGGFQSFNKVALPGEVRATVTKGGTSASRRQFLAAVDAMVATTALYTLVTPEGTFPNRNLIRYEYRRSAERGASLLALELIFEEVRVTAKGKYSTTKAPSGADPINGGPVRPTTPTPAQTPAGAPK